MSTDALISSLSTSLSGTTNSSIASASQTSSETDDDSVVGQPVISKTSKTNSDGSTIVTTTYANGKTRTTTEPGDSVSILPKAK